MVNFAATQEFDDGPQDTSVVIPYRPRRHFVLAHASRKRFRFLVVHRRGGKTVFEANELIKAAITNTRAYPPPRYGYVGPSFSQAKDTIWAYLKHYTKPIPGIRVSESDLQITFPNSAIVALYPGADAYERMRGLYFDGVALDEFPLLNPDAWGSVVRPCLADYRGWAIMSGTSAGDDHFHEQYQKALKDPETWDVFNIKVTDTDALHPDEVADMRRDMGESKFLREMMNSFEEPVEGAYYGELMQEASAAGRICSVPHQPASQVLTWWDLGMRDTNFIWFMQQAGQEVHAIDVIQNTGKGLDWYAQEINLRREKHKFNYRAHVLPHDVKVRELGTGKSREDILEALGIQVTHCPHHDPKDRIEAVRSVIPVTYFDEIKCAPGISALKSYQQAKSGKPLHNWASHPADAFGHGCMSINITKGWYGALDSGFGALRRRIKGLV